MKTFSIPRPLIINIFLLLITLHPSTLALQLSVSSTNPIKGTTTLINSLFGSTSKESQILYTAMREVPLRQSFPGLVENVPPPPEASLKIPLQNKMNSAYYFPIALTDSNHIFKLHVDTGSYLTWVSSTKCQACISSRLDCTSSGSSCTLNPSRANLSISYVVDKVSGEGAFVDATLYPYSEHIKKLDIIAVDKYHSDDDAFEKKKSINNADGLLGLSLQQKQEKVPQFMVVLRDQKIVKNTIFSIYQNDYFKWLTQTSEIALGGYNPDLVDYSTVRWHKVAQGSMFWQVPLSSISFESNELIPQVLQGKLSGILDTGTSFIMFNEVIFNEMINVFQSRYGVNCKSKNPLVQLSLWSCSGSVGNLPPLKIGINGIDYTVEKNQYMKDGYLLIQPIKKAYMARDILLGDVFLREYYFIYNYDERMVGIGKLSFAPWRQWYYNAAIAVFVLFIVVVVGFCAAWWTKRSSRVAVGRRVEISAPLLRT